jgi:hypothetical protein
MQPLIDEVSGAFKFSNVPAGQGTQPIAPEDQNPRGHFSHAEFDVIPNPEGQFSTLQLELPSSERHTSFL